MDANNDIELVAIQAIILFARRWAMDHFNHAHWQTATLLDAPAFRVTFPDIDTMHIEPYMHGVPMSAGEMDYRLCIPAHGAVRWHPTSLMLGIRQMPDLVLPKPTPEQQRAITADAVSAYYRKR